MLRNPLVSISPVLIMSQCTAMLNTAVPVKQMPIAAIRSQIDVVDRRLLNSQNTITSGKNKESQPKNSSSMEIITLIRIQRS